MSQKKVFCDREHFFGTPDNPMNEWKGETVTEKGEEIDFKQTRNK